MFVLCIHVVMYRRKDYAHVYRFHHSRRYAAGEEHAEGPSKDEMPGGNTDEQMNTYITYASQHVLTAQNTGIEERGARKSCRCNTAVSWPKRASSLEVYKKTFCICGSCSSFSSQSRKASALPSLPVNPGHKLHVHLGMGTLSWG